MNQSGVFAFERISHELELLPLAARLALDVAGRKLSLRGWCSLTKKRREVVVLAGQSDAIDVPRVRRAIASAMPVAEPMTPRDVRALELAPARLDALLGAARPLDPATWRGLPLLARFAIAHLVKKDDASRLAALYDELFPRVTPTLTHLSPAGEARMVDVADKPITRRRAIAQARVRLRPETARLVSERKGPKGDVLATARIAGIMASKRTAELIPMCHPIPLSRAAVDITVDAERGLVVIEACCEATDRTGVEMEAMTAASVAALTIYDMLKAAERGIAIESVVLVEKSGGRSGLYRREQSGGKA